MNCPICNAELSATATCRGTNIEVGVRSKEGTHNILLSALLGYWRWVAEGKPKYVDKQYYHDPYHDEIEWLPEEECYRFSIQTCDGPDGDTWYSGKFWYEHGEIEIIEEKSEHV